MSALKCSQEYNLKKKNPKPRLCCHTGILLSVQGARSQAGLLEVINFFFLRNDRIACLWQEEKDERQFKPEWDRNKPVGWEEPLENLQLSVSVCRTHIWTRRVVGPYVPLIYNLIVCITVIKTRKLTKIAACSKVKVKALPPNPHFLGVCRAVTAVSSSLWTFVSALWMYSFRCPKPVFLGLIYKNG